jgi:hypothetical protein
VDTRFACPRRQNTAAQRPIGGLVEMVASTETHSESIVPNTFETVNHIEGDGQLNYPESDQ